MSEDKGRVAMEPEIVETEAVSLTALESMTRSEIDVQIATAHKYPRSLTKFKQTALEMATLDPETAASCFYSLPREGKVITGPSVRLAEIVASAWGNIRCGARIIKEDEKWVTAQGVCHDLERNVASSIEVRRRITDKNGKRYKDDMVGVTANAACSVALRNAIFKVVPGAYAKDVLEKAREVAGGTVKDLAERRKTLMVYFKDKWGVDGKRVLALIEKKGAEDITLEDISNLQGLATALKDGETTVAEVFPDPGQGIGQLSAAERFGFKGGKKTPERPVGDPANAQADPATGAAPGQEGKGFKLPEEEKA